MDIFFEIVVCLSVLLSVAAKFYLSKQRVLVVCPGRKWCIKEYAPHTLRCCAGCLPNVVMCAVCVCVCVFGNI